MVDFGTAATKMTDANGAMQRLRAFVERQKREIQQAEKAYDVPRAVQLLEELARPLTQPTAFETNWKSLYLQHFYRDVAKFVLSFVAVHLEVGLNATQREVACDVFFDRRYVPTIHSVDALISQLVVTKTTSKTRQIPSESEEDAVIVVAQCARLLVAVLDESGLDQVVAEMIQVEAQTTRGRAMPTLQPLVASLCSTPDLVYNRMQRKTPSFFQPRVFFPRLCSALLATYGSILTSTEENMVFRLFVDKLVRIGQTSCLIACWLQRDDLYEAPEAARHRSLLQSLPPSSYEAFVLELSRTPVDEASDAMDGPIRAPKYLLLSLVPPQVCESKQYQFAITHKLLLAKPVTDGLFLRMLVDVLARSHEVLTHVFDVVLTRWCRDDFSLTVDYAINSSVCLFLRLSILKIADESILVQQEWTNKLCKGVQMHMAHSVERVRVLGMRVGETLSRLISPENLLNFEIPDQDPLVVCTNRNFDFTRLESSGEATKDNAHADGNEEAPRTKTKKPRGHQSRAMLDPDHVIDSDDESEEEEATDDEAYDSDSDASLQAYDLQDDEEDLKTQRPLYIKDLLSGLYAEDDREKTETALAEAELLLRKKPKDLHYQAKDVVTALLRLEDKYSTPNFVDQRAKALAAACALSPANAVPCLQKQALEREQLLQSRLDVLQAMMTAAQELSETGDFRLRSAMTLLQSPQDLNERTLQGLKTRRWGYRRDPLLLAKKNGFADHALEFFSPLLFGFIEYTRAQPDAQRLREVDEIFLAHLLHALATFVECAGNAPPAIPMAKALLEFAWHQRSNTVAAVRRQVLFAFSRVLLVVPPFLLRSELGEAVTEMMVWMHETHKKDPDEGCREASRLLLLSGAMPMISGP